MNLHSILKEDSLTPEQFLNFILNKLQVEIPQKFNSLFNIKMNIMRQCKNDHKDTGIQEQYMIDGLNYDSPVMEQIDAYFAVTKVKFNCAKCDSKKGYKKLQVNKSPEFLIFGFNEEMMAKVMEVPETFDLYDHMDSKQQIRGRIKEQNFY